MSRETDKWSNRFMDKKRAQMTPTQNFESSWQKAEHDLVLARVRIKELEEVLRTHEHIEREGCRFCDALEVESLAAFIAEPSL